jgi:hypothetical protein
VISNEKVYTRNYYLQVETSLDGVLVIRKTRRKERNCDLIEIRKSMEGEKYFEILEIKINLVYDCKNKMQLFMNSGLLFHEILFKNPFGLLEIHVVAGALLLCYVFSAYAFYDFSVY